VWRGLTQLPSLITECLAALRTANHHAEQSLLLQQETNLLLRELIVKVTTQKVETPEAVILPLPESLTHSSPSALGWRTPEPRENPVARQRRVLTERDILRNTRSSIAQDQFDATGKVLYPHRQEEILPPTSTRPLGPLP